MRFFSVAPATCLILRTPSTSAARKGTYRYFIRSYAQRYDAWCHAALIVPLCAQSVVYEIKRGDGTRKDVIRRQYTDERGDIRKHHRCPSRIQHLVWSTKCIHSCEGCNHTIKLLVICMCISYLAICNPAVGAHDLGRSQRRTVHSHYTFTYFERFPGIPCSLQVSTKSWICVRVISVTDSKIQFRAWTFCDIK